MDTYSFKNNNTSVGWNLNDSTTSLLPNISFPFLSKIIALHQNVANCQNTLTVFTISWGICRHDGCMGKMYVTNADIIPAPSVRGLPISHDQLDRMDLV